MRFVLAVHLLLGLCAPAFAARTTYFFQQHDYGCTNSNFISQLTVMNISNVAQTIVVAGSNTVTVSIPGGTCGGPGVAQGQVLSSFALDGSLNATVNSDGSVTLNPNGGEATFTCGGGVSGGRSIVKGTVTVREDRGAVIANGMLSGGRNPAAVGTSPDMMVFGLLVNGGRPF